MPLPWIKMWQEALHDPKLTRLPLSERGAWWGLLQLANECDENGKIVSGGKGLTMDEIADALHVKTPEDRKSLETMITKMQERGSLFWNGDILTVVHYEERQKIPPSSRPQAIAERVRRHREKLKRPVEIDKELAEITKLYEDNIERVTPLSAERLKDIASSYPPGWFKAALEEAVGAGVRKLKYIEAILERWRVEGFKAGKGEKERKTGPRGKTYEQWLKEQEESSGGKTTTT